MLIIFNEYYQIISLFKAKAIDAPENNECHSVHFLLSTEGQYHVNQDTYSESR